MPNEHRRAALVDSYDELDERGTNFAEVFRRLQRRQPSFDDGYREGTRRRRKSAEQPELLKLPLPFLTVRLSRDEIGTPVSGHVMSREFLNSWLVPGI